MSPTDMKYMKLCSRFEKCSVNRCPLDPEGDARPVHPKDPQQTCKAHPRERLAVATLARSEGVALPGMTLAERQRLKDGETVHAILAEADARREVRVGKADALKGYHASLRARPEGTGSPSEGDPPDGPSLPASLWGSYGAGSGS